MTPLEVGRQLIELCRQLKHEEAMATLYAKDVISVEAMPMTLAKLPAEARGIEAVIAKARWWADNHVVHALTCEGPFAHGDRFMLRFTYDVTNKPTSIRRRLDEMALFTVRDDQIVREEFFYAGDWPVA